MKLPEHIHKMLAEFDGTGIKPTVGLRGSGHYAITWTAPSGKVRDTIVPATPSDWRGVKNNIMQLRRQFRAEGVEQAAGTSETEYDLLVREVRALKGRMIDFEDTLSSAIDLILERLTAVQTAPAALPVVPPAPPVPAIPLPETAPVPAPITTVPANEMYSAPYVVRTAPMPVTADSGPRRVWFPNGQAMLASSLGLYACFPAQGDGTVSVLEILKKHPGYDSQAVTQSTTRWTRIGLLLRQARGRYCRAFGLPGEPNGPTGTPDDRPPADGDGLRSLPNGRTMRRSRYEILRRIPSTGGIDKHSLAAAANVSAEEAQRAITYFAAQGFVHNVGYKLHRRVVELRDELPPVIPSADDESGLPPFPCNVDIRAGGRRVYELLPPLGAMPVGALASALGVTRQAVHQRMVAFMKKGLVERVEEGLYRRKYRLPEHGLRRTLRTVRKIDPTTLTGEEKARLGLEDTR